MDGTENNSVKTLTGERRRLLALVGFRILTVTFLLGATVALSYRSGKSWAPVDSILLYAIVAVYVLSILYLVALKYRINYRFQSMAQIFADLIFWSCLIFITSGLHSVFTFLYTLSIIHGAMLLGKRGAYVTAALSTLMFFGVLWLEANRIFHGMLGLQASFTELLVPAEMYHVFLTLSMFFLVSLLGGYFGEQLETREQILTKQRLSLDMQRALNRSIVEGISSGFMTTDATGVVTFLNVAAERILRRPYGDVRGHRLTDVFPRLAGILERELAGEPWERQIEISLDSGEEEPRWASFSFSDLLDAEKHRQGRIIIINETTERRRLEEIAFQNEKLVAIGKLAAGIAHEIRNPLASISGSIQMIQNEFPKDDDSRKLTEIILRETDRLNNLIVDFLSYAKPKNPHPETVDPRGILGDIVGLISTDTAFDHVAITVDIDDEPPLLYGDASQLRQMLWNILKNAVESASNTPAGKVSVHVFASGETMNGREDVVIEIVDNGPGLSKKVAERMFDPFYTTKDGGTGLGMSIAHQIIQAHAGALHVDSVAGKDTTFRISLPAGSGGESARKAV